MKKDINQLLKEAFERDFNNAKKKIEAEEKQRPMKQIIKTYPNGNQIKTVVCFN